MENLGDILKRLATTRDTSNIPTHRDSDTYIGGDPSHRFPDDAGEPSNICPICRGRGWFTPNVPAGHPDFGQIITCQCQQERMQEDRSGRLLRYSNLGYLTRFTFETLNPQGRAEDPENQRLFSEAYQTAVEYADNTKGWLVITGPNGSGKTHLAAAIANHCIDRGQVVFFVQVPDLLDHLRATFAPDADLSYSDLFEQVRNTPLLILDGLGSQSTTAWAQEKLHQIINHRFNAELPTVVTTAVEVSELDPYIRSRLQSRDLSRVIEAQRRESGPSHRLGRIEDEMCRRMTFETFDIRGNTSQEHQMASLEWAFKSAKNFAADPDGWLTLFGDTGVGKTHLAVAIAGERMKTGQPVFFAFVPELMDYLRYTFTPESRVTYDSVFDEVKNTPMLILDDLGSEQSSPWANEKLYQIIVHRHNARLPTVISSKIDFTKEAGPISSRVQDPRIGDFVRIEANDYRKKGRPDHAR